MPQRIALIAMAAACLCLSLCLAQPERLSAEEANWGAPEHAKQDIKVTLADGSTVRGHLSAETGDSVMLSVVTDKGKVIQTLAKASIKTHEWVPPIEEEIATKVDGFSAEQFDGMVSYLQDQFDAGLKETCLNALLSRQKKITKEQLTAYMDFLLKNHCFKYARAALDVFQDLHPEWQAEITAQRGRIGTEDAADTQKRESAESPIKLVGQPPRPGKWGTGYMAALKQSGSERKPVLVMFTEDREASPTIAKLEDEILNTPAFKDWATHYVILLRLDYTKNTLNDVDLGPQSKQLKAKYGINSYPDMLLLDSEGKSYTGHLGYVTGGPAAWIKTAESLIALHSHRR